MSGVKRKILLLKNLRLILDLESGISNSKVLNKYGFIDLFYIENVGKSKYHTAEVLK